MSEIKVNSVVNSTGDNDSGLDLSTNDVVAVKTANTERMRVDANGKLGIGATTIDSDIHIEKASDLQIKLERTGSGTSTISVPSSGQLEINNTSNAAMTFSTNNTERFRADNSGNVLFSTTGTPDSVVGVSGAGMAYEANGFLGIARAGTNLILNRRSTYGNLIILKTDGTDRGAIGVGSGNVVYVGGGDTFLSFFPSSDAIYPANDSGGGRDNAIDLGTSSVRFDDIFATNGTIQTSDQQEKNTITDSDLGLDFVKRLAPKSYIFNGKTRTHYGLIAQDVETVLTDIGKTGTDFAGFIKSDISEEQDGSSYRYGLRYTEFVAPLIKAIKEQQTIIEDLQARITALENAE